MSKMLLLADDSVTIQKVVELIFAHSDYDLKCASNGDAALEQARLTRPDIVLADANMPGRNGYELCAAIKSDPGLSKIPVLMLAGAFEPFDEQKAKSAGADGWIVKPFESQALMDEVEDLLARPQDEAESDAELWSDLAFDGEETEVEVDETPLEQHELLGSETGGGWTDEEPPAEESGEKAATFEVPEFAEEPVPEIEGAAETFDEEFHFIDESDLLDEEETEPEIDSFSPSETVEERPIAKEVPTEFETETSEFDTAPTEFGTGLAEVEAAPTEVEVAPTEAEAVPTEAEAAPTEAEAAPAEAEEVFEKPVEVDRLERTPEKSSLDFWRSLAAKEEPPAMEAQPAQVTEEVAVTEADPEDALTRQVQSLSEEHLDRIVERVAGTVIERLAGSILEKIAWEVVPDLAEVMIKEEIRKITESSR